MRQTRRGVRVIPMAAAVIALTMSAACLDMDIVNLNEPDAIRALGNPDDVQSLLAASYTRWWRGAQRRDAAMTLVAYGEELISGHGNWQWGTAQNFPRRSWPNTPGDPTVMDDLWEEMYGAISQANDPLMVMDQGMDFGPGGRDNLRARAFGRFIQGISHGMLALAFDRAYVVDEAVNPARDPIELLPYDRVMEAAIAYLEDAIELSLSGSFTLPADWINGLEVSNQELARLAHSYIARFLPSVARTPEERAAVDWAAVVHHADQGIVQDFAPLGSGSSRFFCGLKFYGGDPRWMRVSYMVIGPADTTGAFQAWYEGPPEDRVEFDMSGPDIRIHAPGDPEAPGTDFYYDGPSSHSPTQRPYRWGRYMPHRYSHHEGRAGPMPVFLVSELDFLKAEAFLRLGNPQAAADLINITRVGRGGLPPVGVDDPYIMEKLVYEKRIELAVSAAGISYFDARGWGFLHERSPLHFPIPALQLELIEEPIYTFGGNHPDGAPPRSLHPVALTEEDLDIIRSRP